MKTTFFAAAAVAAICTITSPAQASSVAGAAKKGAPVGYAKIDQSGAVLSFGGKGTTAVTTNTASPGARVVVFTGKYPSDIAQNNVVVLSAGRLVFRALLVLPPLSLSRRGTPPTCTATSTAKLSPVCGVSLSHRSCAVTSKPGCAQV